MAMKINFGQKPSPQMRDLLIRTASHDPNVGPAAMHELAIALTMPLKQGVMDGDIMGGLFERIFFEPGTITEFPLDFLSPGSEKDFIAYTIPNTGRIPERHVQGDFLTVPTFEVGSSIDWSLKFNRNARWDVVGRALQVLEAMFVRKNNVDAWRVLLAAGKARNSVVYDNAAIAGLFTKRLVALGETFMRRNAGGNSNSLTKGKLTDLYMSPEARQDVLSWDLTQVPDAVRFQIYQNWSDGGVPKIGDVSLHDLDELGVGQEFQKYYEDVLGGTLPGSKLEILVGLDKRNNDSFVMPFREEVQIYEDVNMHRERRAGMYGWAEHGFSVLDNRRVELLAV